MPNQTTQDIRNIALVGHAGSGKTSLVEALLYHSGAKKRLGSVERGDTVTDFDPLEQRHQHSLHVAVASCNHKGRHINLIDTPGYPDFFGQSLSALSAADTMAVVINAQTGIETMTRTAMEWATAQHMPCMVIINKIDVEPDILEARLNEVSETFGKECLPLELPARHAEEVIEVYDHTSGESDFSSVDSAHTALVEQAVEVDEAAMEQYLEEGEVAPNQLHDSFEQALREGHLIPVCFVSSRTGVGVPQLLDVLAELAPNPMETTPHPFVRHQGEETVEAWAEPDAGKPLIAHVFKVEFDPFVGKLGLLRVHQGAVKKNSHVLVNHEGKSIKVAHLFRLQGEERIEIEQGVPGDICAIAKVDEIEQDAILHERHKDDQLEPPKLSYPTPLVGLALKAKSRGDEQKVSEVLQKIVAEDPCLRVEHDMSANETVLRGMGEFHLRVALERMDEQYHVIVDASQPSIPYRETITRKAPGQYRHKKQTGGAGQFGEVSLEVEPLAHGAGFEFVSKVVGGAIPASLIVAIEKGVRQALASGAISGNPVQDIRVTVLDGKTHPVDSKEIAFVVAGRKAFLEAVAQAGPIVLEPMVNLEVTVPGSAFGDLSGDLASRRARIARSEAGSNGCMTVTAQAPLAELDDYASRLKSITGGEGSWSIQFSHYEAATPRIQKELMDQFSQK